MFFTIIPIMEGPDGGSSTLVPNDTEHAESVALAFAKHPAAWLYHFLKSELGFWEDSVLSLLKSFTIEARGLVSETTWDPETWTVSTPYSHISDTSADDLEADGFCLTDANLSAKNKTIEISLLTAKDDLERLKAELQLKDDGTCTTRCGGVSIISGATGFTMGDSSLHSVTEQDLNRELEQACIANAKRMEAEAAARWGDLASVTPMLPKMLLPGLPMTVQVPLFPPTLAALLLIPTIPISPSPLPLAQLSQARLHLESPPPQSKVAQATTLLSRHCIRIIP
jgi:hypothetical protein